MVERILISLYFPQFQSPNNSRFESFFLSLKKKEKENPSNKKNKISKIIYPEKIARNEDKRTSIIIKGIPSNISKANVIEILNKYGNINYLYIAKDLKNKEKDTSIAFVNFINYKSIIPLYMAIRNLNIEKNQIYNIKIKYANAQGKEQLKEYAQTNFWKYK